MKLTLRRLNESFAIHSLPKHSEITALVLPQNIVIDSDESEPYWQALESLLQRHKKQ